MKKKQKTCPRCGKRITPQNPYPVLWSQLPHCLKCYKDRAERLVENQSRQLAVLRCGLREVAHYATLGGYMIVEKTLLAGQEIEKEQLK